MPGEIHVGCSGWNYGHWRNGVFYPSGLRAAEWLPFYATEFETVELNTTFYRLPRRSSVERWALATPADFVFAVKVSRFLTHVKRLREAGEHLARLLERIEPLAATRKLGPLLWQLPPTFRRDDERLAEALAELPTRQRHAFEFRHPSWFAADVIELLRERNAALVVADRPEIASFQTHDVTADFVYVRFHHGSRGRRGNYSGGELDEWAERIGHWAEERDVFAYFNNDWDGFAPANAATLGSLVAAGHGDRGLAGAGRGH